MSEMECSAYSPKAGPSADDLAGWLDVLAGSSPADDDAARIDRIAAMEQVKSALCAAQARETVAFKTSQLTVQRAAGLPATELGKGIGAQVALARRESPHRGSRFVGLAEALTVEMPHTMAALTAGVISEWRAMIVTKRDRVPVSGAPKPSRCPVGRSTERPV